MLLDLVQSFLRATVEFDDGPVKNPNRAGCNANEFTEVSITSIHACTIWIFSHVRLRFYLYCTDGWLVFLNSLHL